MALTSQEIAATQYFDEDEYVEAKARIMVINGKANSLEAAKAQFLSNWTGDMIDHYLQYGAAENVNPSNSFDNSDYIEQVAIAEGSDYGTFKAELEAEGTTPLEHFLEIGEAAGYTAPAVSEDEQVVVDDGVEGDTFTLTSDTDNFEGTADDDTFNAPIVQNAFAGGVSNSLSSAAKLDGGAGTDTLNAELVNEFIGVINVTIPDVQPETTSIEDINIEARDNDGIITLDAKYMTGIDEIGSYMSDGDLVIENLTTLTDNGEARNTSELTITMDHTDNFNSDNDASDLTVYFDEDYLLAGETTQGSQLVVRLVNAVTNEAGGNSIEKFSNINFNVGETLVEVDITAIAADSTLDYTTAYDEVVDAINAQLIADGFTTVTATKAVIEDAVFSIPVAGFNTGDAAGQYYPITITNTGAEELTGVEIGTAEDASDTDLNNSFDATPPESADDPLAINVELEKVGRDGEGGDLFIGGKFSDGIPNFYITVKGNEDQPSDLGSINTNTDDLENVYIKTDSAYEVDYDEDGDVDNDDVADLIVRDGFDDQTSVELVDADEFSGDLTLGTVTAVQNLETLTALGGGDVTMFADYTDLNGVNSDTGTSWTVTTGAGDDTLDLDIDGDAVDAKGESFAVSTGAGDDDITVNVDGGVSQATMAELGNLSIDSGAGNDEINLENIGNWDVDAGAGDDTVYVANNGNDNARAAIAETQTITFGNAGDSAAQGQVTVNFGNGFSVTTTGISTNDTSAQVANRVVAAIVIAGGPAAVGLLPGSINNPGDGTLSFTYDTPGVDYDNATVEGILTDSAAAIVETTPGVDGTDAADATKGVLVVRSAGTSADGATVTVTDGNGVVDTITLVDTDGNGVVSGVEFATQMAAATYTDFVVTGSNPTLGEVYLETTVAEATGAGPYIAGTGDAVFALAGTDNEGNTITSVLGTDAIAFAAGTAEVQTITVTNGADQEGDVVMEIDLDADGAIDAATEVFTFDITAGNEGSVAAQLATQINALDGVSAAQGAAGATIDDVIITWDLKTATSDDGVADQAAAISTFEDGAIRSATVVETTKGLEATAALPATWLVNYNGTDIVNNDDTSGMGAGALDLLYGASLTVTYSGATTDGASGVIADAAVATENGFESTVTIDTDGYVGNFVNINDAIMAAIQGDGANGGGAGANVLEELLSVSEGNLESLIIESVIDGEFNEADLAITMNAADVEDMTNSQKAGLIAALQTLDGDSEAEYTDAQIQARLDDAVEAFTTSSALDNLAMADDGASLLAGEAGDTENDSTIELGTGDDVIVLSTHGDSNNTLVYEDFGNGHDTVVNFTETGAAMDMIDFSSYLDAQTSASGSAVTAVDYAQTLNTDTTADLDEVTIINDFAQDLGDAAVTSDDETWAGLTADNLLAALNNTNADVDDAWGNIQEADLDVASITDLVGSTYNHIVMVENDLNDGEYKVFNLVAKDDADFTDVELIGVVDFGDTLANVSDANFA